MYSKIYFCISTLSTFFFITSELCSLKSRPHLWQRENVPLKRGWEGPVWSQTHIHQINLISISCTWVCVRGHPFPTFSVMFCCHTSLSDVGPASWTTLWPQTTPHVPWTLPHYVGLMYISCSYVPRSRLCLTADLVAWYCIVRVYTHHLS